MIVQNPIETQEAEGLSIDLTPEAREKLQNWADLAGVSVEVLLNVIAAAAVLES